MSDTSAEWLQQVDREVERARRTHAPNAGDDVDADRRYEGLLPIQYEYEGQLLWADASHRIVLWSAIWSLAYYAWWLLAILSAFFWESMAPWAWGVLAGLLVVTLIMRALYQRREKPMKTWREQAKVIWGAWVYANTNLFENNEVPVANAAFVFSFDEALGADPDALEALAKRCFEIHAQEGQADQGVRELADRLDGWSKDRAPGDPHTFDRVQVPRYLAGNDDTWLTMAAISRDELPGGVLERRLLPLMARPGHSESVQVVPYTFWPEHAGRE